MTIHQKPSRLGCEYHPELGYVCPSHQLRQNVRVGLTAALFGIIAGVATTIVLLPRRSVDVAWSEPVAAVESSGPVNDATPLRSSSPPTAPSGAPAAIAARVATEGVAKQRPAAPASPPVGPANLAPPAVETPAQAAPVTSDQGTAGASGQVRTVARKRTKTANSAVRRRGQETPYAFGYNPFGFQTGGRFADDARSARRQDWGGGWRW